MLRHPQKHCFETFCRKSNPCHSFSLTLEYSHSVHLFVWFPSHSSLRKPQCPVSGAQSPSSIAQDWLLQVTFLPPGLQVRVRQHRAAGLHLCCCGPSWSCPWHQASLQKHFFLIAASSFTARPHHLLLTAVIVWHACD